MTSKTWSIKANESVKANEKNAQTNNYYNDERNADQYDNEYENDEYYYHYYDNNDEEYNRNEQARYNQQRAESFDPFEFWTSNIQSNEANKEKSQAKNTTSTSAKTNGTKQSTKEVKTAANQFKGESQKTTSTKQQESSSKQATNACYKKFAVASYAHLLNEPEVEQPKQQTNKKTNETTQQAKKSTNEYVDLDKIASNVNSTGKQKWKNSTKPTQTSSYIKYKRIYLNF